MLTALLLDPAVSQALLGIVTMAITYGVTTVSRSIARKKGVEVDQARNNALIAALERTAFALLARGVPALEAPAITASQVAARFPDTIASFKLDRGAGPTKLRDLAADAVTRLQAVNHQPVTPAPIAAPANPTSEGL